MSLQPSRATGRSENALYTVLLVISAVALLAGFILVQIDLFAAYKVIWLFKVS
jgi:hypothetical protein